MSNDDQNEIFKRIEYNFEMITKLKIELEKYRKGGTEFDRLMAVTLAQKLINMGQDPRSEFWVSDNGNNLPF